MEKEHEHKHTHSHSHTHIHDGNTEEGIKLAFFLNFGFAILEILGGLWTNSVAILSDAIHDFGDSLSLGMAWYFQKFSKKRSDKKYTYGYKRFSLVGALVNSVVLTVGSVLILIESIPRLFHPEATNAGGMFLLAIVGIAVNGFAMLRLRKGEGLNARVVSLHMLEDVLGWAAVLVGAAIMYFTKWYIIDPILSVLIAIFILSNIYKNMRELFRILLQGTPYEVDSADIVEHLKEIEEIAGVHDLHVWSIDGIENILTVHVVLKQEESLEALAVLKGRIRTTLHEIGIEHATIEFEAINENCGYEKCCG